MIRTALRISDSTNTTHTYFERLQHLYSSYAMYYCDNRLQRGRDTVRGLCALYFLENNLTFFPMIRIRR